MKSHVKKVAIGVFGGLVLLAGIAMLVLPGPAFLVIPAGLAILATEFHWAHRCNEACRHKLQELRARHRARKKKRAEFAGSEP